MLRESELQCVVKRVTVLGTVIAHKTTVRLLSPLLRTRNIVARMTKCQAKSVDIIRFGPDARCSMLDAVLHGNIVA